MPRWVPILTLALVSFAAAPAPAQTLADEAFPPPASSRFT